MTLLHRFIRPLALVASISFSHSLSAANITLEMDDPEWTFLLKSSHQQAGNASLTSEEGKLFRELQPLLAKGDYQGALTQIEQNTSSDASAALYEIKGQVLLNLKRYEEAAAALNKALEMQPGLAVSHRALGMIYLMQQDFKNAKQHLSQTLELGGNDAQTYGQLAYVNLQLHKPHSAVAGYQTALYLDPENSQWYQGLLYALTASNDFTQAASLVDEMLIDKPKGRRLWVQRAQIAMNAGNKTKALGSMETALALGADRVDNIALAARLHMELGNPRRAVELLSGDIRRFAKADDMDTVLQMGRWLASRDEWSALERLVKAVSDVKGSLSGDQQADFLVVEGQAAIARKHFKTASSKLAAAIELAPGNGEALITMANVQKLRNNQQSAVMYYLRAETLPEFKTRALQGRAQVEIDRKDYAAALDLLRQLYKEEPNRQQVFENIQTLERIVRNQA